jgi:diguanylate cyclase (GGDEF)-like protein
VYLDIDDFKRFNSTYSETIVDVVVLPRFMKALESSTFGKGHAYREGGDEYVLLLPNAGPSVLQDLDNLRQRVANLAYRGVDLRTQVSIGLCIIGPDCYLTDAEVKQKANLAKEFAKQSGKNCIATYSDESFEADGLSIVSPLTP